MLHLAFQLGTQAQAVLDQHVLEVVEAAFEVFAPGAGALQPVCGAHVEHQYAVDQADEFVFGQVGRKQLGVARLHAAVAADVEVPALLGGDDADVLALRLGAFAGAAGHTKLDLVRRTQALVAVLQLHGQADAVVHAVAAPGGAHAAFHGAQRLAVGMARLEARSDQLFPNGGQLFDACTEHVHARPPRHLGVQAVFLGHLAHGDQAVGCDLTTGHTRHHGVAAVLLDVAQEVVVAVLQTGQLFLEHKIVPARSQHTGRHGFTNVTAQAFAVLGEQLVEALDVAHPHQVVNLLA